MKQMMTVGALAFALVASAQQVSLSDACARIDEAIANPSVMSSTMQGLSSEDQLKFIAQVNAAVAQMPGSPETKAAAAVDANRAALNGAQKGSLSAMLAEVFATAPLASLPAINEIFASDLFNRAANPSVTYTDEQYVDLAKKTLAVIAERNSDVDNGAVRTGFAILMFVRASNGAPEGLADLLAESILPKESQNLAKAEWFPAALAKGDDKSYDPMLVDVLLPNEQVVLRLAHAQYMEAMLTELNSNGNTAKATDQTNPILYGGDRGGIGAGLDNGLYRVPFTYNRKILYTRAGTLGSDRKVGRGPIFAKGPTEVLIAAGALIPPGAVAGHPCVQVIDPNGQSIGIREGDPIPPGSRMVGGPDGPVGKIVVPPGTPLTPGGVPVDESGKPKGPGGNVVYPGEPGNEPKGYDMQ